MAISLDEVDKIAKLAKLTFKDDEKQKLQHELSDILNYVDQLKDLKGKTAGLIADDPDSINLMRDDVAEQPEDPEIFLAQAPASEGNFVKVKSILE
jgi:aspartyl-tRNA(Asn)/glutamyl-tRNA(Gln) amidotransferase subunit C